VTLNKLMEMSEDWGASELEMWWVCWYHTALHPQYGTVSGVCGLQSSWRQIILEKTSVGLVPEGTLNCILAINLKIKFVWFLNWIKLFFIWQIRYCTKIWAKNYELLISFDLTWISHVKLLYYIPGKVTWKKKYIKTCHH
jgi:hypothetical protein